MKDLFTFLILISILCTIGATRLSFGYPSKLKIQPKPTPPSYDLFSCFVPPVLTLIHWGIMWGVKHIVLT
jgi:hypothetical protein